MISTATLILSLLGPPQLVLPDMKQSQYMLAPHPINFKSEVIKIDGYTYKVWHTNEDGVDKVFLKKKPRINFWGGGKEPPIPQNFTMGGDPPFEVGDKVYLTTKMKLGIGVVTKVQLIKPTNYLWWVTADFLTKKGWVTKMSIHTKFKKAYTEEQ